MAALRRVIQAVTLVALASVGAASAGAQPAHPAPRPALTDWANVQGMRGDRGGHGWCGRRRLPHAFFRGTCMRRLPRHGSRSTR